MIREVAAGAALVVLGQFAGLALSAAPAAAVLLAAVTCLVATTLATDWLARVGVGLVAGAVYVIFTTYGGATGSWPYLPLIGFAALLGAGYRTLRRRADAGGLSQGEEP